MQATSTATSLGTGTSYAPVNSFLDRVARRIVDAAGARKGDLSGIAVLVPNGHAGLQLAKSLSRATNRKRLVLPTITTLADWAQTVAVDAATVSDSQRAAVLYSLLREREWFGEGDLWVVTRELLALFDELTTSLDTLPADAEEFAAAVQASYEARQNAALHLEARLVFELWHAMLASDDMDAARAYQHRLALIANEARLPLFVLRVSDCDRQEREFLEQYAMAAPVTVFDLRTEEVFDRHGPFMRLAFSGDSAVDLRAAAVALGGTPSLAGRVSFFPASGLEQEARAAAMQVRLWLQEGKREIAIVAQNRVAARRMRAILERHQVLVADETGWKLSTLSVTTVIDRWLTALQGGFAHNDLLDLLKSPYIFADVPAAERKADICRLEQLLRKRGVAEGISNVLALVEELDSLRALVDRLRAGAAAILSAKRRTLAGWQVALQDSLELLGVADALKSDHAGAQLVEAIGTWATELDGDTATHTLQEWRRWLALQLDSHTYCDASIDSPVRFTHLSATRCRTFDAVLLLGCGAEHLPGVMDGSRWFNDSVRGSLQLTTRGAQASRLRDDLGALLTLNDTVLVTWQSDHNGEARLLSPYLQIPRGLHMVTYGDALNNDMLGAYLDAEDAVSDAVCHAQQPTPSVPGAAVPQTVSTSAYNSLVACPYQFYARHVLRLNELDEVPAGMEKRDYGELVHEILSRFHQQYPSVAGQPAQQMEACLRALSEQAFRVLITHDFEARAWLERWLDALPAYIAWQADNESEGWSYVEAESAFEVQLDGVTLRGRIDRLDTNGADTRVLDYKTQGDYILRGKLEQAGEDVQLPSYLLARKSVSAAFVSIESGKVKTVAPKDDIAQLVALNAERLVEVMKMIRGGAGLPANGVGASCDHCEMRGVCRKGCW